MSGHFSVRLIRLWPTSPYAATSACPLVDHAECRPPPDHSLSLIFLIKFGAADDTAGPVHLLRQITRVLAFVDHFIC